MDQTVEDEVAELKQRYSGRAVNVADLVCDRFAAAGRDVVFSDGPDGGRELSYEQLRDESTRLAGSLRELGVEPGHRVAVMLPKSTELVSALVAIWRLGAVEVPLFTAFGPDAAGFRIEHSEARVAITDVANRPKLDEAARRGVRIVCVGAAADGGDTEDLDFATAVREGEPVEPLTRGGEEMMILLYTSGTTGQPKGVEFPIEGLASVHSYMSHSLDLRPDDVFWNIADPGWGYGLWFGVIGAMLLGQRMILRNKPFDAGDIFTAIGDHGVTNITAAPTAFRSMRAAGVPDDFRKRSRLRVVSSAGEPLNPELLRWSQDELGVPIHDHYGQSETGMTVAFHHDPRIHREPVPSATGYPSPGFRMVVLGENGQECDKGVQGEMAIDIASSPLYWFRGYYHDAERTAERFRLGEGYYLTADAASQDSDGLLHFASRADDVISSAGYRIGPFEIENALISHDAVAEVAVIGTPDELRGEAVTAFVVTSPDVAGDDSVAEELREFVKSRLAKHMYPRHVAFVENLPRTPSGKVRRTELREQWNREQHGG